MNEHRTGIIDIGSNSIRLVVYEQTASGAHRVIDGSKRPARLSSRITADGNIDEETTEELVEILSHFRLLCAHHRTGRRGLSQRLPCAMPRTEPRSLRSSPLEQAWR